MGRALAVIAALAGFSACANDGAPIPDTCNGDVSLCSRGYTAVSYPTAHNAMSNMDDGWILPNQEHGISRQLEDGVRGLMLDTHDHEGEPYLCHGDCLLGSQPLVDGLGEIADFLDANRGEVVTIIFESYITEGATEGAFADADLLDRVYSHAPGTPWPTLRELIDAGTTLVVFTDDGSVTLPWHLYVWDYAWETHYAARETTDFSCDRNRGEAGAELFIFNHFLTRTRPVPEDAGETNADPFLVDRARTCMDASGQLPNFVTVDFYATGDLFEAVRLLNDL